MAAVTVVTQAGGQAGSLQVSSGVDVNRQLLHDAAVMYATNRRLGTYKSKSRAEVIGCSKKLFKQKGTGNARMGNKRTPIRRGGGHCFAKRPKDWSYRLPKKALRAARSMALATKLDAGRLVVLESLKLDQPKTSAVVTVVKPLRVGEGRCLLAVKNYDPVLLKSCRNVPWLKLMVASELNADEILRSSVVVMTRDSLESVGLKVGG